MSLLEQLEEDEKYSAFFFFLSTLGLEPQTFHNLRSIPLPLDLKAEGFSIFVQKWVSPDSMKNPSLV